MKVSLPLTEKEIEKLRAGEKVLLKGEMFTLRDASLRKLLEFMKRNSLPFSLEGALIYYSAPTITPPGKVIGSCGPTTSKRMDPYTFPLLERGVRGMLGKGERSKEVREAIKKFKAVYFITVGGAGAYLSRFIRKAEPVLFPELGPETILRLEVEDFPCWVAIDSRGESIFPW